MRKYKNGGLTNKQLKEIQKLETVLKECADLDIVFVGMDGNLLAYDGKKLMARGYHEDPIKAQEQLDRGYWVFDSSCYLDSGGW